MTFCAMEVVQTASDRLVWFSSAKKGFQVKSFFTEWLV